MSERKRHSVPVELNAVEAGYHGHALLPAVDLRIEAGQTWALIGRNGAGKSTLLRTILGLLPSVAGRVERDESLAISYVPQRSVYDPSVPNRVIDVVREGIDHHWSFLKPGFIADQSAAVDRALEVTLTADLASRRFASLSEGQKQRVLIAKALVTDPALLVLDEPTSAMDPVAERAVFELLDRLRRERNLAIVIASHTMSLIPTYATHAILVDADERLVTSGEAERVLMSPEFHERYGFVVTATAVEGPTRDL